MFADRQTGTMTPSIRTYAAIDCPYLIADIYSICWVWICRIWHDRFTNL